MDERRGDLAEPRASKPQDETASPPLPRLQPYQKTQKPSYKDDPKVFSSHAYGISVDINPMTNPYHDPRGWWPAGSDGERDRSASGLITAESEAVKIFMRRGWIWGGLLNPPDYMHFGKITVGDEGNPLQRPVWASRLEPAPN